MSESLDPHPRRREADPPGPTTSADRRSLTTLLRDLAEDGRALLQQEVSLAKLEIQTSLKGVGKNGALIGSGLLLLALGALVLIVFVVLGLGRLLGGQYWLSSLIVGGTLSVLGLVLVLTGRRNLERGELKPRQTAESLRDTKRWASDELEEVKRELVP